MDKHFCCCVHLFICVAYRPQPPRTIFWSTGRTNVLHTHQMSNCAAPNVKLSTSIRTALNDLIPWLYKHGVMVDKKEDIRI